jgi:hypothetical protein
LSSALVSDATDAALAATEVDGVKTEDRGKGDKPTKEEEEERRDVDTGRDEVERVEEEGGADREVELEAEADDGAVTDDDLCCVVG